MANILIVDDAAFMRMVMKNIVLEMNHQVVAEAANGLQAIQLYGETKPDLVTMDITMPDMDGIAAVKGIKAQYPEAKIIMCSAMGQQLMVVDAIRAGACDFIVKPIQKERVIDAIDKALAASVR